MSEEKTKLSGPDLTQGVELSTIPDGTMCELPITFASSSW